MFLPNVNMNSSITLSFYTNKWFIFLYAPDFEVYMALIESYACRRGPQIC